MLDKTSLFFDIIYTKGSDKMEALDSVSYDQYSNIPSTDVLGIKTKIILSEECYLRILQMISKTRNSNNETGAFFVGRKSKEELKQND